MLVKEHIRLRCRVKALPRWRWYKMWIGYTLRRVIGRPRFYLIDMPEDV